MTKQLKVGDAVTVMGGWGKATVIGFEGRLVTCETEGGMKIGVPVRSCKRLYSTLG